MTPIPENSPDITLGTSQPHTQPITPSRPTETMITLGNRIRELPLDTLSAEDIQVPRSSVGTTVLVALLMDIITTDILPNVDALLRHNFAHLLMTTAPDILIQYYKRRQSLQLFVEEWRTHLNLLPVFVESELCPCKTPLSIKDPD